MRRKFTTDTKINNGKVVIEDKISRGRTSSCLQNFASAQGTPIATLHTKWHVALPLWKDDSPTLVLTTDGDKEQHPSLVHLYMILTRRRSPANALLQIVL